MATLNRQSGFTAVELLITLFVAAAFLIASYQLFNLVIKDGGATRAQSRAANVAYDYLRQYAASATTIPCTASSPLNAAPLSVDGLTNVTINVTISCLPDAIASLSKVEADVTYNNPSQTVAYATYTSSTGSSNTADITNGMVAWWKLNGNANNSVGSPNGVITNATSTPGQNGTADNAYAFGGNASGAIINTSSNFGIKTTNATISLWVYNPTASNSGEFVHIGVSTGFGIGIGNTQTDNVGTKLIVIYDGNRWIPTTANLGTGWHHVVLVVDASGTPTIYLDGVSAGSYPGTGIVTPSGGTSIGGLSYSSTNYFNGSIDDVRVYNRALPLADILAIYSKGAQ
ncbi:MAG: Laminin sub protein [Candidatus Saccharibacteria bacterium]|nr:Laminin sub protein [Candidatus Saccharibacteria bacterium]